MHPKGNNWRGFLTHIFVSNCVLGENEMKSVCIMFRWCWKFEQLCFDVVHDNLLLCMFEEQQNPWAFENRVDFFWFWANCMKSWALLWSCSDKDLRVAIPGCPMCPSGCALLAKHHVPQFSWPQKEIWLVGRGQNNFGFSSWFGGVDRAQDCLAGTSEQLKALDLQTFPIS